MNLSVTPNLVEELSDSFLIIDTCALIDAIKTDDFLDLMNQFRDHDCELFSIEAAKYEFLRGASTPVTYANYKKFLKDLGVSFINNIEQKLDTEVGQTFMLVFNQYYQNKHLNKQPSYVDMLLLFTTYFYTRTVDRVFLLTANHRDIPGFFRRTAIIAFEENSEIRTEALYKFAPERFDRRLDILLKSPKASIKNLNNR